MFRDGLDAVQSLLANVEKPPPLVLVLDVPRRRNLVYWVGGHIHWAGAVFNISTKY